MARNGMSCSEAGKLGAKISSEKAKKAKEERIRLYNENPRRCKLCQAPIPYDKHFVFCSRSCAAIFNNRVRKETNPQSYRRKPHVDKYCENCGKLLPRHNTKFCSNACQQEYQWKQCKEKIKQCGEFPYVKEGVTKGEVSKKVAKRYLIEQYGRKCAICGITEWCGKPAPLVLDHIDGNTLNNRVDNFRLVCGNCDMQLPTYKSKNKNSRPWRRA